MFDAIKESAKQHRAQGDTAHAEMLEACAEAFRAKLGRLVDAANAASELLDGCPDDDTAAAASLELSEAAATVYA